jgi:hypothetical protein
VNRQSITTRGHTIEQNVPLPSASAKPRFQCNGDRLHIEYTVGGAAEPYDYARAR